MRRRTFVALLGAALALGMAPGVAEAKLDVFHSDVGTLKLSVDGVGMLADNGVVQAEKPSGGKVRRAFLFGASRGFSSVTPADGSVTIDGAPVAWDPEHTIANGIQSYNVAADVTELVRSKIDGAPAGRVDLRIGETNSYDMDGEVLAVIFNDPAARPSTVYLMYGAQQTSGDTFNLGLAENLKASSQLTMGLGISFGSQPTDQASILQVGGATLSSSAGGQDDGQQGNGALLTVGGLDDSTDNPNPTDTGNCEEGPRCDDELYDLKPFIAPGDRAVVVDTRNPTNDDNIFFAAFSLSGGSAVIGSGLTLSPSGSASQVGHIHRVSALVQDQDGKPVAGRKVTFDITSGPGAENAPVEATTNVFGKASFAYTARTTGEAVIQATWTESDGTKHISNPATHSWKPAVAGTFGGAWGHRQSGPLTLSYSYGGDHRFLGNVVQGQRNWNDSSANVQIDGWRGAPYALHVPVADVSVSDSWWGMAVFENDCLDCSYVRTGIWMNRPMLDIESDAQRTKVATHEFGHVIGLMHSTGITPREDTPSVMHQGRISSRVTTTPQSFDTARVNRMYP